MKYNKNGVPTIKDDFSLDLAAQVKAQRKRAGISMEKLAEMVNVWPCTICLVEKGKRRYSTETLGKILYAIGGKIVIQSKIKDVNTDKYKAEKYLKSLKKEQNEGG